MALTQSHRPPAAILGAALVAFVLTPSLAATTAVSVSAGEKLAFARDKGTCLTCHVIKGGTASGNVGPPLVNIKERFPDRNQLFAIIYDETKRNPQTVMPPFGRNLILTKDEINEIIDFLYTR
jgi:L-cysteine S-thiosulfotransferase